MKRVTLSVEGLLDWMADLGRGLIELHVESTTGTS